jgi:hypothetical protein
VDRSIAQGHARDGRPFPAREAGLDRRATAAIGLVVVLALLGLYVYSNSQRWNLYNHFVWQASAWLEGETAIRYPVLPNDGLGAHNEFFQDVMPIERADGSPSGRALIPFPPLPALVVLPAVAIWGFATDSQLLCSLLGALVVGIAYWTLGRLPIRFSVRLATTLFLGVGTVIWYASMLGTTWYLAHLVATGLMLGAVGLALGGDPVATSPEAALEGEDDWYPEADERPLLEALRRPWTLLDWKQVAAGMLLGLACGARLTAIFGAPLLVFVGGGGSWRRRVASTGLGLAIPLAVLVAYNLASTGHLFSPVYEYLYRLEAGFYTFLNYNLDWAIEDPRYIPQNLGIALLGTPDFLPACDPGAIRGWFDPGCPYVVPKDVGMSVLLTSPGWLLVIPALRLYGRSRIMTGAAIATAAIAFVNLMHFSQGWVQFGYRFSNDLAPFAILLVALGLERLGGLRPVAVGLIAASIVVNWWGVIWGVTLGW